MINKVASEKWAYFVGITFFKGNSKRLRKIPEYSKKSSIENASCFFMDLQALYSQAILGVKVLLVLYMIMFTITTVTTITYLWLFIIYAY